jgi:hypothetical protein
MLDQAHLALETQSVEDRDITSVTMAIDKSKVVEAKALIKAFRRRLSAFLEEGAASEVYARSRSPCSLWHLVSRQRLA